DKIEVLNAGNSEQVGSPLELYRSPRNLFVAGFIGSPRMNFIDGPGARQDNAARVGVRPAHIALSTAAGGWKGTVGVAEHLGSDTLLHIHTDEHGAITVRADGEAALRHGDTVYLTPDTKRLHRFDSNGLALQ